MFAIDLIPSPDGNIELCHDDQTAAHLTPDQVASAVAAGEQLFVKHYAKCEKWHAILKAKGGCV